MPLVQKTCEVSKRLSELRIILKSSVIAKATLTFRSAWLYVKAVKCHWQSRIQTVDRYNKLKEKLEANRPKGNWL
jgi:hypothetical protein